MRDDKATWVRSEPGVALPVEVTARLIKAAFPRHRVVRVQPLSGGLRTSNFRLDLEPRTEPVVLRIYECGPTACQKEVDLHRLIRETVPVPEILHAQPAGMDGIGPFVLMRYVLCYR